MIGSRMLLRRSAPEPKVLIRLSSQQQRCQSSACSATTTDNTSNNGPSPTTTSRSMSSMSSRLAEWAAKRKYGIQDSTAPASSTREFTTINDRTPYNLCFLRHGQSTWNRDNRFIGWTDTPLTDDGVLEARVAGQMLANSGILFDEVHTSLLRRCIRTTNLVLMETQQEYLPVHKHWRLNERSYGDLVGLNKKETVKKHGVDQVKRWRRSYDEPPPPMNPHHEFHPARDPRYRHMLEHIPASESLMDTKKRSRVYWDDVLAPALHEGKTLLVVGHENNLRSIIMRLEGIPKEEIINLCLPRAVPLAYRLDENLEPLDRQDGQLDSATGYLRGEWLGGDDAVAETLDRDRKQVYDTSIEHNLETSESRKKWTNFMSSVMGAPGPEARAKGENVAA